jgi:hypothetical protein
MFAQAITPQGNVRLAVRVGCLRQRANVVPEEWPSRIACLKQAVPYKTRLTGWLTSCVAAFSGEAEFRFASRKHILLKMRGSAPTRRTPRQFYRLANDITPCVQTCPRRRLPCGRLTLVLMLARQADVGRRDCLEILLALHSRYRCVRRPCDGQRRLLGYAHGGEQQRRGSISGRTDRLRHEEWRIQHRCLHRAQGLVATRAKAANGCGIGPGPAGAAGDFRRCGRAASSRFRPRRRSATRRPTA